jgi:hypothetical protein
MSDAVEHFSRASHNLEFMKLFYSSHKYNDWAIAVAFDTSIHIFEHALAKVKKVTYRGHHLIGIEHSDQLPGFTSKWGLNKTSGLKTDARSRHYIRTLLIEGSSEFSGIFIYYNSLYKKSRQSKYNKYAWSAGDVDLIIKRIFVPLLKWFSEHFNTKLEFQ